MSSTDRALEADVRSQLKASPHTGTQWLQALIVARRIDEAATTRRERVG